jgi:uncharacterized coiled-coil protein SlyX
VERSLPAALFILAAVALSVIASAAPAAASEQSGELAASVEFDDEAIQMLEKALERASPETKACISCHQRVTPMIVYDWLRSKHAWSTPGELSDLYSRLGEQHWLANVSDWAREYRYTVGCFECHGKFKVHDRPDVVNHFGFNIVTIVTPQDCSQCHPKEYTEISWTWHGFAALNGPLSPWYKKVVKAAKEAGNYSILPGALADTGWTPVSVLAVKDYSSRAKVPISWPWYRSYVSKILAGDVDDPEVKAFGTIYDYDFKNIISPLYPVSGVANSTQVLGWFKARILGYEVSNIMEHPMFKNSYVYHGCLQCHGSMVVPYKKETVEVDTPAGRFSVTRVAYWGWPNNGAGRIDPDGSMGGTCTACHTRHVFSVKQAREPWTCGQCHLGYDHPHIEIYEESKHGNIYDAYGEQWNWEQIPWRPGVDFSAPTCAACHMSALATPDGKIVVRGTHDLAARLVWDQMHFFSFPKPKSPDHTANAVLYGAAQLTGKNLYESGIAVDVIKVTSDSAQQGKVEFPRGTVKVELGPKLAERRSEMKAVCGLCHSEQWVDNYFKTFDQNMIDYNVTASYAYQLLQKAYSEGIHDPTNKLDEYMEIMWYYIWHHDGRRWRNGAAMMGPDFAHWFGAVDTVMDKLGRMISYYETVSQLKALIEQAEKAEGPELEKIVAQIQQLEAKIKQMESEVPVARSALDNLKSRVSNLEQSMDKFSTELNKTSERLTSVEEKVQSLGSRASVYSAVAVAALVLSLVSFALSRRARH